MCKLLLVETACAGDKWNLFSPETVGVVLCLSQTSCCTCNWCDGAQKHLGCSEMGPLDPERSCGAAGCPLMVHSDFWYFTYGITMQKREKQQEGGKKASRECYFKW